MDENTRAERVWLLKDYMQRINEPGSDCPPLVDLRLAFLTACLHDDLPGSTWETVRQDRGQVVKGEGFAMSLELGSRPLEWLGLNAKSALEMFMPEHPHADWRAGIGEPGYVTFHAVTRMLDHYADTGQIRWQASANEAGALEKLCENHGIVWLAWQAEPQRGWMPPGAERTAIVRFDSDAAQSMEIHLLEQLVSDIAGYNVSLITPEQIWEERRQPELERAEVIYAQAD